LEGLRTPPYSIFSIQTPIQRVVGDSLTEFLMKVELELSSLSSIALTLRKPFVEPDPIEKLRLTSVFQRMADSFLLILI
jgi:hypothetical protein